LIKAPAGQKIGVIWNLLIELVLHHEAFKFEIAREGPTSFGTEYHLVLAAIHGASQGTPNKIFDAQSCKSCSSTDAPLGCSLFAQCYAKTRRRSFFTEAIAAN